MSPIELLHHAWATPDSPRWHELRRQGVTASEIPVILGLSTWDSAWALWHRKRGLIDDNPGGQSADWGRRLEPAIADAAADRLDPHGNLAFVPAGLYRHPVREWQMATPDRKVHESLDVSTFDRPGAFMPGKLLTLLEVKHPYSFDGWGDDGTDDIPADYLAQALWQCDVMGVDECWLAAYSRHEMRCYTIRADAEGADADLELMRKTALEFLQSADPPPLDSHPVTLRAVKALHPDVEDREQILPDGVAGEYTAACMAVRHAEARKREAEAALRLTLGSARRGVRADMTPVVTRSVYTRRSLDTKALRTEHPDLADKHTTTSTVDKLTPARKDPDHDEDQ